MHSIISCEKGKEQDALCGSTALLDIMEHQHAWVQKLTMSFTKYNMNYYKIFLLHWSTVMLIYSRTTISGWGTEVIYIEVMYSTNGSGEIRTTLIYACTVIISISMDYFCYHNIYLHFKKVSWHCKISHLFTITTNTSSRDYLISDFNSGLMVDSSMLASRKPGCLLLTCTSWIRRKCS